VVSLRHLKDAAASGRWPFASVPDPERARYWAGRPEQKRLIDSLLNRWGLRDRSEINVIWADYGQGKSHTLLYMLGRLQSPKIVAHYLQLPAVSSGSPFVRLYEQIMRDFPFALLADEVFARYKSAPMNLFSEPSASQRYLVQMLWLIGTRAPGSDVAERWLRGMRTVQAEHKELIVGGKRIALPGAPRTAPDCLRVLDDIVWATTESPISNGRLLVLLIDEFQRIGSLSRTKGGEVCDSLHLLFNRHPRRFHLLLSFATGLPQGIPLVLTKDLINRVSSRVGFRPLTHAEGRGYVQELMRQFAEQAGLSSGTDFGPFESKAVDFLLERATHESLGLSPRRINIMFDLVTSQIVHSRADKDGALDSQISQKDAREAFDSIREQVTSDLETQS